MKIIKSNEHNPKFTVKQNLNFLEHPTFVVSHKINSGEYADNLGYRIITNGGNRMPMLLDRKVLYTLIGLAQLHNEDVLKFNSTSELLKVLKIAKSGQNINRVINTLHILTNTCYEFKDSFYNKGKYESKTLKPIKFKLNGGVEIKVDEVFLDHQYYYATIGINTILSISSGFTLRMFELLRKSFFKNNKWSISYDKLIHKTAIAPRDNYSFECIVNTAMNSIRNIPGMFSDIKHTFHNGNVIRFVVRPEVVDSNHIFSGG